MMEENGLPRGWVETTLGEVVEIKNNKILTAEVNLDNYISTENLLPDKRGVTISNALPNILNVNHYKINDTLFSNIRTYFKKVWHADREGGASNDVLIFRPKNNKIFDHKFLYYHISSDNFIDFTVKTARGTKMPRGDKSAIINSKIFIPQEIQEQKAIASILTSFDDKIELLQAQNETLENIAQTIFKEWFGKYKVGDELPEGWRVGKLGEEFDITIGRTPPRKEPEWFSDTPTGKKWISIKDMVNSNIYISNTSEYLTDEAINKFNIPIIPKNTTIMSFKMTVGKLSITSEDMISNEAIAHLKVKNDNIISSEFIFLYLQGLDFNALGSTSSIVTAINSTMIKDVEFIIPDNKILKSIQTVIFPLFEKIKYNSKEIFTLSNTRDTLLPKLMSGQLRIEEFK